MLMTSISGSQSLADLSAVEIVRGIAASRFTAQDVVKACLERIQARNTQIRAWEAIKPELAVVDAYRVDSAAGHGRVRGVPVGVKDVIDYCGLHTQMGSELYEGYRPWFDASCVAIARDQGAIVIGKTTTSEFAGTSPTETRNPLDFDRTPGGSSSGSAAAVADRMVPIAFGTQTGGSIIRPAAFCGVVGFKPSYGTYSMSGVRAAAVSLDTVGLIAQTVDDIDLFHCALTGIEDQVGLIPDTPPRIGICRTPLWDSAKPETVTAIEDTIDRLQKSGATLIDAEFAGDASKLVEYRTTINDYERAIGLWSEWSTDRKSMTDETRQSCEAGLAISHEEYSSASRFVSDYRRTWHAVFDNVDILLTPATAGEAPLGRDSTGDLGFQALWTMLHVPAITLPTHSGPNGLPVGIQLVGPHTEDMKVISFARWASRNLLGR